MAIKLHVKSEGMSNTLVTMTTDRQQFHKKMSNFESLSVTMVTSKQGQLSFCDILKVLTKTFHMRYRTIRSEHKPFLADKMCLFS